MTAASTHPNYLACSELQEINEVGLAVAVMAHMLFPVLNIFLFQNCTASMINSWCPSTGNHLKG